MPSTLKRILVGPPIPTREERRHRLPKTIALAVFSSDAISSTAYATEEILRVLMPAAGAVATVYLVPISLVVIVLLALVASSYRQTIHAYIQTDPPEDRNAATTLTWMACILGSAFLGISYLTQRVGALPTEHETVLSVLGTVVFGRGFLYGLLQAATSAILVLAANTAFADFPRLSALMARDRFLPTQLVHRGDRLVFSNGILLLAAASSTLLVAFHGDTSALIPLYAVGVFTSFTLSQAGMVRHHMRLEEHGWRWRAAVNAVGGSATLVVLAVVVVSKFTIGAWIPAVLIPLLVTLFKGVHRHYERVAQQLEVDPGWSPPQVNHTFVVLVNAIHKGSLQALAYAESLRPRHLVAVAVACESDDEERLQKQWAECDVRVPLEVLWSPYRRLVEPILGYLDQLERRWDDDLITVVIPEYVVRRWWEHLLHNQDAFQIKARLWVRRGTAVTSVPYHLD